MVTPGECLSAHCSSRLVLLYRCRCSTRSASGRHSKSGRTTSGRRKSRMQRELSRKTSSSSVQWVLPGLQLHAVALWQGWGRWGRVPPTPINFSLLENVLVIGKVFPKIQNLGLKILYIGEIWAQNSTPLSEICSFLSENRTLSPTFLTHDGSVAKY